MHQRLTLQLSGGQTFHRNGAGHHTAASRPNPAGCSAPRSASFPALRLIAQADAASGRDETSGPEPDREAEVEHLRQVQRPTDAEDTERAVRERLAGAVFGGWAGPDPLTGTKKSRSFIRGVTFEEVKLEGTFPNTEIVMLFRSEEHPDVLFGRRQRVWEYSGDLSGAISVMDINLMEDVESCRYGLPSEPAPDAFGVAWL